MSNKELTKAVFALNASLAMIRTCLEEEFDIEFFEKDKYPDTINGVVHRLTDQDKAKRLTTVR